MKSDQPVVFVVDDDSAVRHALRRLIMSVGLIAEVFATAQEFLDVRRPPGLGPPADARRQRGAAADLFLTGQQLGYVMQKMQAGAMAELVRFAAGLGVSPAGSGPTRPT
jgi:FixJ family two-component response regulator